MTDTRFTARLRADNPELGPALARLGTDQQGVLDSIARQPYPDGGWHWNGPTATVRLLDGLVKRGLVTKDDAGRYAATSAVSKALSDLKADQHAKMDADRARINAEREAAAERRAAGIAVLRRAVRTLADENWLSDADFADATVVLDSL